MKNFIAGFMTGCFVIITGLLFFQQYYYLQQLNEDTLYGVLIPETNSMTNELVRGRQRYFPECEDLGPGSMHCIGFKNDYETKEYFTDWTK